ncbi:hypothetical protein A3C86_04865 [Candidatus Kaiserbacteria bacterium RIFCSPHIGHO2_02_FULL_49_16]|uniref:Uncharacterized protein n=1 Tax=Candidatus Kaiserbacteria bacterium RIFCSPHIGHO2_02_FULL_49_16 TaxID=1798490 RepID=A0A1F6DGR4_9BACT|nr:MAG: hypothetical protein A3C86_04865 [Candidatus Kaiserbacteria bacterium RIFCSPHIGHO2_02_FULL_49_16]
MDKGPDLTKRQSLQKLAKLSVVGASVLLGVVSQVASATGNEPKAIERGQKPEKSRTELAEDYKIAGIEKHILNQFDAQDIQDIMGGYDVKDSHWLSREPYRTRLDAKITALMALAFGAILFALKELLGIAPLVKDEPHVKTGAIIGASAGTVALLYSAWLDSDHHPTYKREDLDIVAREVKIWLNDGRKAGLFVTEASTKRAIAERIRFLAQTQNKILTVLN